MLPFKKASPNPKERRKNSKNERIFLCAKNKTKRTPGSRIPIRMVRRVAMGITKTSKIIESKYVGHSV
jgi:hypothetical protein